MRCRKTNLCSLMWMFIALLGITLIGVTDSSADKKVVSEDNTSVKEVKKETQDLIQALDNYTAEQRDEALERIKTALDELDKRIDTLETHVDNNWDQMNKAAREKSRANLKELRKQRTKVFEVYSRLKTSSADAWEDVKKGFSDAYKKLSNTWEKSEKEFSTNK